MRRTALVSRGTTKPSDSPARASNPAILFDVDGTLLDSNYEHVLAWRLVLRHEGLENAFLHRCIGMRDELLIQATFKETGRTHREGATKLLGRLPKRYFERTLSSIRPLPGSVSLLRALKALEDSLGDRYRGRHGHGPENDPGAPDSRRDPGHYGRPCRTGKPDPDVFLIAARRLGVALSDCSVVVGDSVWDLLGARRAKAIGVGLCCGGYDEAELAQAGAYRVYKDSADLLDHVAEIAITLE